MMAISIFLLIFVFAHGEARAQSQDTTVRKHEVGVDVSGLVLRLFTNVERPFKVVYRRNYEKAFLHVGLGGFFNTYGIENESDFSPNVDSRIVGNRGRADFEIGGFYAPERRKVQVYGGGYAVLSYFGERAVESANERQPDAPLGGHLERNDTLYTTSRSFGATLVPSLGVRFRPTSFLQISAEYGLGLGFAREIAKKTTAQDRLINSSAGNYRTYSSREYGSKSNAFNIDFNPLYRFSLILSVLF